MGDSGMTSERDVSFKNFLGDRQLIPHVTNSREGTHYCIYCGEISETREHSPSKVFLTKPYPDDLPVLPACKKCNNGFSDDELYTEVYIDALKYLSGWSSEIKSDNKERIYRNTAFSDAQKDLSCFYCNGIIQPRKRIERILTKLAICHTVYELSEGYASDNWNGVLFSVSYNFSFELSSSQLESFNCPVPMGDKILPEMGSRVFDKIYVLEPVLQPYNDPKESDAWKMQIPIMDWSEIQDGCYRYVAWFDNNDLSFHVRIVIHDFMYSEIVFRNDKV